MYTFQHISDPGHGWLKVPRQYFSNYDLSRVSAHSYMDQDHIYLEEDDDLTTFLHSLPPNSYMITSKYVNANDANNPRNMEAFKMN